MNVDGSIRSLIQGVSQQPPRIRIPGQCTVQENFRSNPVEGLQRRPPTVHIKDLYDDATAQQYYDYELGGKRYIVAAGIGNLRVFDTAGNEYPVTEVDDAFDYLDGGKLNFTTIEKNTFVANTTTTVAMLDGAMDYETNGSIIYILGGQYSKKFEISIQVTKLSDNTVATTTASFTTPNGSTASHIDQIATSYIANALLTAITTAAPANVTYSRQDDHILIQADTGYSVTVQTSDDFADTLMRAINGTAKQATHVPKFAPHGYVVRVQTGNNADSPLLYLVFRVTPRTENETLTIGSHFGRDGIWFETVAPDIQYALDTSTMPHTLVYDEEEEEFVFSAGDWKGRRVGDENSNSNPSFVGSTVNYMSYFQGRLVILSGISCVMSRTNDPFDFYFRSAISKVPDDPIDIRSTAKNVDALRSAVPFNRDLIIFAADNAQFIVFGRTQLTSENAALVLTTTFENELRVAPVAAGRNIFFAINYGKYTGIREFFTEGSEDVNDARPITDHVLKYMEGKVTKLATTSNFNTLLVQTDKNDKHIYVYEYIWSGNTKLQASWSTWIMPNSVQHMFFVDSVIYMVVKIGDDYSLESTDLDTQFETDLNYMVHLDRKYSLEATGSLTLPYDNPPDIDDMIFVQGEDCANPGLRAEVDSYDPETKIVTFKRNYNGRIHFGQKYLSRYVPTMPFVKDADGVKIGTARLVISQFRMNYRESGSFSSAIMSKYRDDATVYFSGRIANDPNTVVGVAPIQSGTFIMPFRENAEYAELEIYTDNETPLTLMDIEWRGQYTKRGQRITQGE